MAAVIHLDTHVVVWLYAGQTELISAPAQTAIEQNDLRISPMVALELQYLFEINRVSQPGHDVVADLEQRIDLHYSTAVFVDVVAAATRLSWTRDPFDRLISAQAIVENAPLLTADRMIQKKLKLATW